ncbi:hypothetical protein [Sutterella sp.]|uniref:hypothetical protein n=1 Tax=Sutterella sp. TaxID=1981025 RepID=UPI0026E08995|nr:hypothetical protein [Sutterella sp.]MDO5531048.1 hypothetical protein [Sutterella sp.]
MTFFVCACLIAFLLALGMWLSHAERMKRIEALGELFKILRIAYEREDPDAQKLTKLCTDLITNKPKEETK